MHSQNFSFRLVFLFLFFIPVEKISAQYKFQRTYEGINFSSGRQTSDGGYIATGFTKNFGAGNDDIFLLKVNPIGETQWFKTYGSSGKESSGNVQQTLDGGYIVVGTTYGFGLPVDIYLIKTDANGDTLWTRAYGTGSVDNGWSVQQTPDSGYIICGKTQIGLANDDVYLLKTDPSGNLQWTKTYGGAKNDIGISVINTNDNGFIIIGATLSFGPEPDENIYMIKTNDSGDTLWSSAYSCYIEEWAVDVLQTSDGGYIVLSNIYEFGAGQFDYYVVKTDPNGEVLWAKAYGTELDDGPSTIYQTHDGGYIIAGGSRNFVGTTGQYDMNVIRINSAGDTLWTRLYGRNTEDDVAIYAQQTTDSGFVIFGGSYNPTFINDYFSYLIKTDKNGNTECNNSFVDIIVTNAPTTRFSANGVIDSGGIEKNISTIIKDNTLSDSILCVACGTVSISFDETICQGEKGIISVSTSVNSSFLWEPSSGLSCSDCPEPKATPDSSLYYHLTVTDINGCESLDSIFIKVDSCAVDLLIPNMFSPDGDGINDQWVIKGITNIGWELHIFNRWGELMYHTESPAERFWGGSTFSGKEVHNGVYYYILKNQEINVSYKGYLHLMR